MQKQEFKNDNHKYVIKGGKEVQIQIDTNLAELPVWITGHVLKQATFAMSVALYDTAADAKQALIQQLPEDFTIRNTFVAKGIRIKPTGSKAIRKTGAGIAGMEAQVGTVDAFMAMQELGGTKKGKSRNIAIPVREPETEIMDKKKWPKAILKKPGYFMWQRQDGRVFVFHRESKKRYPIQLKYSFAESVKVPPRWNMRQTVSEIVNKKYNENFNKAFEKALATAKR